MSFAQFIKMASSDPVAARGLAMLVKLAAPQNDSQDVTNFDESVPATQIDPLTGRPDDNQQGWQPQNNQVGTDYAQESQYLPPNQATALQGEQSQNPMAATAEAARIFIGSDIFNAAMQGDQNAIALVSQVASSIATGNNGMAIPAGMDGQASADEMQQEGAQQDPGVPAAPATPEEQIANMIIQPVEQTAPQPPTDAAGNPQADTGKPPAGDSKPPSDKKQPSVTVKVNGGDQEKTSADRMATLKLMASVLK